PGPRIPTQIGTENDWVNIAAADGFVLATKTDGTLWSWGKNNHGQLGLTTNTNTPTPTQIGTAMDWSKIDAMNSSSMAVSNTGTVSTWGEYNTNEPIALNVRLNFVEI